MTLLSLRDMLRTVGEHAGFQAGGAEDGELAEGDALDGEESFGVDGPVDVDGLGAERVESSASSMRRTAKVGGGEAVLAGVLRAERALPSAVRGPVERTALARLAARRFSESGSSCWFGCSTATGWSLKSVSGKSAQVWEI